MPGTGIAPVPIIGCILWNPGADDLYRSTATYSCIMDGDAGTGNIGSDPLFVDSVNGDYRLQAASPCIDIGDPSGAYEGWTDIDGNPRVIDIPPKGDGITDIDIGADEYQPGQ